ncbi:hypothetical protein [Microbispora sp. H10949]|uniref:hypothetical protein n=1 Tax=Microbispora sp. H10949 TaxID=2729111 RepID=UPI0016013811|nr:hypothetical protein [Microbispora sp. H10949]
MSLSPLARLVTVVTLSVAAGVVSVVLARRAGKSMSASLLVGLTVGTGTLGGLSTLL